MAFAQIRTTLIFYHIILTDGTDSKYMDCKMWKNATDKLLHVLLCVYYICILCLIFQQL